MENLLQLYGATIILFILCTLWIANLIEKQSKILKSIEAHLKFQNDQIKKTHEELHPKLNETLD